MSVILFTSAGCAPCAALKPTVIEACDVLGLALSIEHVTAASPKVAAYNIRSVPTVVVLKEGAEMGRFTGLKNLDSVMGFLELHT